MIWLLPIGIVLLIFGLTVFRGAPYVPAHRRGIEKALDLLDLKPGDAIVDLGSGDGVVLRAAARRGLRAYGYEINPFLCLVSWLRARRYGSAIKILWRDFWFTNLPADTRAVFVFAGGPFMRRLTHKLAQDTARNNQPLLVASYGFELPGLEPTTQQAGINIYRIDPKA